MKLMCIKPFDSPVHQALVKIFGFPGPEVGSWYTFDGLMKPSSLVTKQHIFLSEYPKKYNIEYHGYDWRSCEIGFPADHFAPRNETDEEVELMEEVNIPAFNIMEHAWLPGCRCLPNAYEY